YCSLPTRRSSDLAVLKSEREGFAIQQVMAVSGQLLQVEAAERQVGAANSLVILIYRNDFQKPVCRDYGTIRSGDVLLGIEAEGHGGNFTIHANAKCFILLQH